MLRCAEITQENNYKYFVVVNEKSILKSGVSGDAEGFTSFHKPQTTLTIECFTEKPANATSIVYDAEQVKTNMKAQYNIK